MADREDRDLKKSMNKAFLLDELPTTVEIE